MEWWKWPEGRWDQSVCSTNEFLVLYSLCVECHFLFPKAASRMRLLGLTCRTTFAEFQSLRTWGLGFAVTFSADRFTFPEENRNHCFLFFNIDRRPVCCEIVLSYPAQYCSLRSLKTACTMRTEFIACGSRICVGIILYGSIATSEVTQNCQLQPPKWDLKKLRIMRRAEKYSQHLRGLVIVSQGL